MAVFIKKLLVVIVFVAFTFQVHVDGACVRSSIGLFQREESERSIVVVSEVAETSTDQEADAAILEVVEVTEVGEIATVTEAEDALTRSKVEATATEIAITATAAAAAEETTIVIVSEDEGQRIQREHRMLRKL
ncbi:hypothetical protein AAF712_012700 [Marasmius tenuissimus]|uniref:Uncharacterized protein n=1 Tax=Marasmius tenuissimus TaxID=585030 RepID=A0ABR2ZFS4_9AGAR